MPGAAAAAAVAAHLRAACRLTASTMQQQLRAHAGRPGLGAAAGPSPPRALAAGALARPLARGLAAPSLGRGAARAVAPHASALTRRQLLSLAAAASGGSSVQLGAWRPRVVRARPPRRSPAAAAPSVPRRPRRAPARSRPQQRGARCRRCRRGGDGAGGKAARGGYREPPKEILDIVDAPPQPGLTFSPDRSLVRRRQRPPTAAASAGRPTPRDGQRGTGPRRMSPPPLPPRRAQILQLSRPPSLPPIFEISRPELKLAGVRIDAEQFSRSRMSYYTGLCIVPADTLVPAPPSATRSITGYPEGAWLNLVSWSPDGRFVSFTTRSPGGPGDPPRGPLQLWLADVATGAARPLLGGRRLNTVFDSYAWVDDTHIVAAVVPQDHGPPPSRPPVPGGPRIQDNSAGVRSQSRTYTDLLRDDHDGELFEYYGTSELLLLDVTQAGSEGTRLAPPRMYTEVAPSPDGQFLLACWLSRPFSYELPAGRFPVTLQLWDRAGALVRELASLPLATNIPIDFNSCRTGARRRLGARTAPGLAAARRTAPVRAATRRPPAACPAPGPRAVSWRDDKPAELSWIEAQDGGDPSVSVSPRDVVYTLDAAAAAAAAAAGAAPPAPEVLAATDLRCGGVSWCDGDLALLYESWWKTRRSVVWTFAPDRRGEPKAVLFDRSFEDVYSDPGAPLTRRTAAGTYVLAKVDGARRLLLSGTGASPEGNRPFLDLLDLDSRQTTRLWQSAPPHLESVGTIMSDADHDAPITLDGLQVLLSRESVSEPPQTYLLSFAAAAAGGGDGDAPAWTRSERRITDFPHPYPQLRDMQKEVLRYARPDGVDLTATLYLPPGYDAARDGPLPTILWAYPREYKSKEAAGQMRRSPYQFSGIGSMSPTLWLTRNYAVLDGPGFPIVAEGSEEPNDTYVQQLSASAEAAVKELVRRGVTDPARVSIGGHSYGAFMAANLLAHCPDLFAAGIARSGAYNRTLTPFGFQSEERTLWQAPETYAKMSPFMMADKIKKPLLLIHGEEDNNTGTFPLQSERFFAALKGHGAPARLVLLPHEGHGYRARESVLHMLYEQDQWLEAHAGWGRTDPDVPLGSGDEGSVSSLSE
ncbi:hypothetical protein HT031_002213 [Scenedesmus sp. PABB004]|nr:hypothetical protein HT031_002213 [Scenedesmus sp. PABB004]